MRIVLNTRTDDASGAAAVDGLAARLRRRGVEAVVGDWDGYDAYDVALFLPYDEEMDAARAANPDIRVVLADPKLSRPEWQDAARRADMLLVSSVEQRDAFYRLNRNVVVVHMFPPLEARPRAHEDGDVFVVAYHGNRIHLEAMRPFVSPALEELGRQRRVAFLAVYDIEGAGRADVGVDGRLVEVRHVQWTPSFANALATADAGIVPAALPVRDRLDILEAAAYDDPQLRYEPFDHLLRFKVSTNAGRIYPFALLEIPVVADFAPSLAQVVHDGESGFLAASPHGWFEALDTLASSAELRARMGAALRRRVEEVEEADVAAFLRACRLPLAGPPPALLSGDGPQRELGRLSRYRTPRAPLLARLRRRLR